jgi:hypothetical protein
MSAFLNPIQFYRAAEAAGIDRARARSLYGDAIAAVQALTAADLKSRGVPKPLTPRSLPVAARGALKTAIEKQNERRAAAVEIELLTDVFVTFCADVIADVRFEAQA